jgi:murein DD-endopeptidase MepM/ murein hydrolase activator NlpD
VKGTIKRAIFLLQCLGGNKMNWGERISTYSTRLKKLNNNLIKKVAITTLAISTLTLTSVSAESSKEDGLQTIYHIYMNNEYVGAVTDKAKIEAVTNDTLQQAKKKYPNYNVELENKVSYIKEQVFTAKTNNKQVLNKVSETISVESEAYALVINDKAVAYVKDEKAAEETIKKLKLKYVTEQELQQVEKRQADTTTTLPPLKENETRVLDVKLEEKLSFEKKEVNPSEILSPQQATDFLLKGTLAEKKYKVQEGDVLGSIAEKHDLTTAKLLQLNPNITEEQVLQIGDEVNVTVSEPIVHVAVKRETNKVETVAYEKEVIEDSSMYKGDMKVKQEGQEGERSVTYVVDELNGDQTSKNVKEEQVIKEPVKYIVVRGTKVTPSRGSGNFTWPTNGGYISSRQGARWGKIHKGIDIARPSNYTIKSVDNGVVVSAGFNSDGYGNKVIIDHNNGYRTLYAHLDSINVSVGETVAAGEKIGVMGQTGESTGVHLHLEVYKNGSLVNPLSMF